MGKRLSQIVTRTGDSGTTGLGDGRRVAKDDARITALGEVDELNSQLGMLLLEAMPDEIRQALGMIQNDLFDLGGELAVPGMSMVTEQQVAQLDGWLAHHNAALPRLDEFVLPGGCRAAALAHVARTVCRRAERSVVHLAAAEPISDPVRQYLNRLSDLLFVLSRVFNRLEGAGDIQWSPRKNAGSTTDSPKSDDPVA